MIINSLYFNLDTTIVTSNPIDTCDPNVTLGKLNIISNLLISCASTGSCLALNLNYPGCCVTPPCINYGCYCDQACYIFNDCCNDVADIGCHPFIPKPIGKTIIFYKICASCDNILAFNT